MRDEFLATMRTLILLLLTCLPCLAQFGVEQPMFAMTSISSGSGAPNAFELLPPSGYAQIGIGTHTLYATRFTTPNSNYTARLVQVYISQGTGLNPAYHVWPRIYDESGSNPGSNLGDATNIILETSVPVSPGWVNFGFNGVSLTANTPYWLILIDENSVDYGLRWHWTPDGLSYSNRWGNTGPWTVDSNTNSPLYRVWNTWTPPP